MAVRMSTGPITSLTAFKGHRHPPLVLDTTTRQRRHLLYCAFIQVSDPASLTDTFVKKIRAGLPSAVPRWSVEIRRGPAFLYPAQVVVTTLGFFGPPRW